MKYTAVIFEDQRWLDSEHLHGGDRNGFWARIMEIPGCITPHCDTLAEVETEIPKTIEYYLDVEAKYEDGTLPDIVKILEIEVD